MKYQSFYTQIAKDVLKHPLNTLAGQLSVIAVAEVGAYIKAAFKNDSSSEAITKFLIEKYFIHPCKTNWMDNTVINWAKENKQNLNSLHKPFSYEDIKNYYTEKDVDKNSFLEKFNKVINSIKNIFLCILLASIFNIVKAQKNDIDSNSNFLIYSSPKCGFQFWYPKSWKKIINSKRCDATFIFQDTVNSSENYNSPSVLFYFQNESVKLIGRTKEHILQSISNTRNLARDSFMLLQCERKINNNKVIYYDIRFLEKINNIYGYHYVPIFIRDSTKNLLFDIELTFPKDSCKKYNIMYEFICNNFKFLNTSKKRKMKKNKVNKTAF